MFPTNNLHLSISNLPSDVVLKIISDGLESIEGMRLISHRWSILALEHLTHRDRLPVIKCICWHSDDRGFLNPIVQVANKYRNYFGLQYWRATSTAQDNELEINHARLANSPTKRVWFVQRLARLVKQCSSVERLQFTGLQHDNIDLDFIKEILGDVNVQELLIAYHFKSVSSIIRALQLFTSVRRIILSFNNPQLMHALDDENFPIFLRNITQMVPTVEFTIINRLKDDWTPQDARTRMIRAIANLSREAGIPIHFESMEYCTDQRIAVRITATRNND